jgi:TonB family protein
MGMSMQPDGSLRALLPEGDYRISWSSLPAGYEIRSVTSGNVDLLTGSLKVSADAPPEPIKVLLSVEGNPWVKVSGRVTNAGYARTLLLSGPNVDQIQLTVNADGTFEIPQALPGQYQIRPNLVPASPSLVTQPISVIIPNQDTTNLIIPLPLTKVVQGMVVNNSGTGVEGRFSLSYSQTTANSSSSGSRTITVPSDGKFTLEAPPGGDVRVSVSAPGYSIKSFTYGTTDLTRENMRVAMTDTAELRIVLDTTSTTIGPAGGVPGGILTTGTAGTLIATAASPPPPPVSPPPLTANVNRVTSELAQANLVSSVAPVYPALASAARVQGSVRLQIEISIEGRVQNVTIVSGHPLLNDAAIQAVRQRIYKPFVLNGQTIPVITTATVTLP